MVDSLDPGKLRDRMLRQTVHVWAGECLDDAKRWVQARPDPEERLRLLEVIEGQTNSAEKPFLMQLEEAVSVFLSDEAKLVQIGMLSEKWAAEDFDTARDWIMDQPQGKVRDALVHRIALLQAEIDPIEAARLVAEEVPPGPAQDEAVLTVVNRWALGDPAAAAEWVANFPDGPVRSRAHRELAGLAIYRARGSGTDSAN
jgi:hypothetical protein